MPRTLVRGTQVLDRSIAAEDLASDSVITEKIKDRAVTCEKIADACRELFLTSSTPIGRIRLATNIPANTDFTIPGGLEYDPTTFSERVAIYRNGQLLFGGSTAPIDENDPVEVYPGSTDTTIKFSYEIRKCETIQVVIL